MRTRTERKTTRHDARTCNTPFCARSVLAALLLALATGAGCYDEAMGLTELGENGQAIIGGSPTSGHAAVVALVGSQGAFCSGTLVRPTVVVTAAHCLEGASASGLSVYFGNDATRPGNGELIPAAGVDYHPSYNSFDVSNDIGVVTLSRAASATPIDVQASPMAGDWVGRQALFVGFGTTNPNSDGGGVKFAVSIPITEVAATTFTYSGRGVNTCYGDSGGPAFHTDGNGQMRLIGVTSWGDEACSAFGVNTRVDAFISYLQPFLDGQAAPSGGGGGGGGSDFCADEGWYGDGWCDEDCPNPDPDCGGGGSGDGGGGGETGGDDFCADEGWYNDGWCDEDCPNPDPDCGGGSGDGGGGGETGGEDPWELPDGGGGGETGGEDPWELPDGWPGGAGCSAAGGGGAANGLAVILALAPLVLARRRRATA